MAEEEMEKSLQPSFPTGRVKRIVKLDKEINKLTSEALLLISASAELFIQFLAERSAEVAGEKKRKTVKLEHLRVAVKRHHPTSDFLLDSLPQPEPDPDRPPKAQARSRASSDKPAPPSVRRIDSFFRKSEIGSPNAAIEKNEESEQRE